MPKDYHKDNPVSFRPTPENRTWLQSQKDAGQVISSILNSAIDILRKITSPRKEDQS